MGYLKKRSSHHPQMDILTTYIFKNHYITSGDVCNANTATSTLSTNFTTLIPATKKDRDWMLVHSLAL